MKKSYLTLKDYAIDFTLSTASAGVQLIPFIGSAINQMTFGYMNSLQVTRIENYLVELSKYLESKAIEQDILNKINEYLTSDEGQEFFYINLEKVTKTRNEHKRKLYRNILLNQSTKFTRFSLDTSEEYLNNISRDRTKR